MLMTTLVIYSNGNSEVKAEKVFINALKGIPGIIAITPTSEKLEGEIITKETK